MNYKELPSMFIVIALFLSTSLNLPAQEISERLQGYSDAWAEWRSSVDLPALPELHEDHLGIIVPSRTLFSDIRPPLFGYEVIHRTPFIVRPLSDAEKLHLVSDAGSALEEHYRTAPRNQSQGFDQASIDEITIYAVAEWYSTGRAFASGNEDAIAFLFLLNESSLMQSVLNTEERYAGYVPWLGTGMSFLILERRSDGTYVVTNEGAAG